ncbi:hypothetical protein ASU33_10665 [Solirubrum puertoriconensis]|uniref:Uncharacterized protein n=2 Tax=Solirubrum puertoriconensis TaxID=1751427 RepID=A0A9X0HMC7_SOLP1|nr:hypothetical protein ASU33_10665 [Solirubrum puertoriconensis]
MNPEEKRFLVLALCMIIISIAGRAGHWLHKGVAPTLVLFSFTFAIAAISRYNRRTNAANQNQPPQALPSAPERQ